MQAVGCREPTRLGSAFLLGSLDGSEKDNSRTRFVRSATRNQKLETCPGIAQGAQFLSQPAWAIRDFSSPHVYLFDRIRHAYTSLKNLIVSPLFLLYPTQTKNRSLQHPRLCPSDRLLFLPPPIGFFSSYSASHRCECAPKMREATV